MFQPNDEQIIEYLRRSYSAVDGLWFMKVEEKSGFEEALDIDKEVWKVLPKIQARMLKSIGNVENGLEGLLDCFKVKMTLDGFQFKVERGKDQSGFRIIIERCPWFDLLVKSKESISPIRLVVKSAMLSIRSGLLSLAPTFHLSCKVRFAQALSTAYFSLNHPAQAYNCIPIHSIMQEQTPGQWFGSRRCHFYLCYLLYYTYKIIVTNQCNFLFGSYWLYNILE